MSIRRGKRRSVIVECGRWRFRLTIGRFRTGWEHKRHAYGLGGRSGLLAGKVFLVTFMQRGYR